VKNAKVVQL